MNEQIVQKKPGTKLIASKSVFQSTFWVFSVTIVAVWIWGLIIHRTLYGNALFSTNILSIVSALFFTTALFKGFKLKDNLGRITSRFKWEGWSELPSLELGGEWSTSEVSEGFFEAVLTIIAGLLLMILFFFSLWLFGNLMWAFTLSVTGVLYWIFFRAVRMVLKNTRKCKGNLTMSFGYGFFYAILYSSVFYLLIFVPHFLLG